MPSGPDSEMVTIDARGLKCPLPVLKARKAVAAAAPGDVLAIETTDPLAVIDIPNFCQTDGHELVTAESEGNFTRFIIRKGGAARTIR